jgi:cysteinyl-tRNA synthetase
MFTPRLTPYQEILEKYTPRQLRLAFLTQLWTAKVDFSESLMTGEVRNLEVTINVRINPLPMSVYFNRFTELFHNGEGPCQSS